jgi:hypothetical protein
MLIVDTGRCTCTAIPCVVFVSDLRHFLDMPEDVPVPARRMAEHLTLIVRAATAGQGGAALGECAPVPAATRSAAMPGPLRPVPRRRPSIDRVAVHRLR